MKLPDGTILMHAKEPYDPAKAHEYYLRTRKLKGRKAGIKEVVGKKQTMGRKLGAPQTYTVTVGGKTAQLTAKQLKEQKAYAAQRVVAIKKKLAKLNAELKKRVAEAKKAERDAKKPDTAAEKSQKARDAKKYRDKNQQKLASKGKRVASENKTSSDSKPDSVAELKKTIVGVNKSLKAAVERQRVLTSATKNG